MKRQFTIGTLQLSLPIRHERFDGADYLVAPVVALVEGVHVGSHGAYYYPPDEIEKATECWAGRPIPVFHPEEYGKHISANTPQLIEERSVGHFFYPRFDSDGAKLRGEVWINVAKAQKIAPEVLSIIRSGRQLEVSTALWFDDDGAPGEWQGEQYLATASNFRPDHLALLPGGEGACSWMDGCGIRANDSSKGGNMDPTINVMDAARTPSFDGTESSSWAGVTTTFAAYRDAYYRSKGDRPDDVPSRVQDAPAAMKRWIASKTLLGDPAADNERDLTFFPVVNPGTGKLNEGALRAVITGRGAQAQIPAGAKRSAQNKARSLLNRHFGAELETDESGLKEKVKGLLRALGGTLGIVVHDLSHEDLRAKLQHALDGLDNPGWIHFVKAVFDGKVVYEARGNNPNETGSPAGAVKLYERGYSLNEETGEVTLKDDAKEVREETRYVLVEHSSAADSEKGNQNHDEEDGAMEKKELVNGLVACDKTRFTEQDRDWLEGLSVEQLEKLTAPEAKVPDPTPSPPAKKEPSPEANQKPKTVEEYVSDAPPEVQVSLNRALKRDREIKDNLVKSLMDNQRNKFTEEQLRAKEIDELEQLASLANLDVDFSGQAGGSASSLEDERVPEMPPVFNLSKKPEAAGKPAE